MKQIIKKIVEIQDFIENINAKDSQGKIINNSYKLCFIQEDLTELKKIVEDELDSEE